MACYILNMTFYIPVMLMFITCQVMNMAFYWTSILNGQKAKQGEKHVSTLYIYNNRVGRFKFFSINPVIKKYIYVYI